VIPATQTRSEALDTSAETVASFREQAEERVGPEHDREHEPTHRCMTVREVR
jgi:hypothetical protein